VKIIGGRLRLAASDVANFLACQHLTRLDLRRARGELHPPVPFDLGFQVLVERGEAHEREVLDRFRADGRQVVDIGGGQEAAQAEATAEAIRGGAEVIYQGVLAREQAGDEPALLGRPDFIVRADLLAAPDGEPRPGGTHYEVIDAKLARSAKARAVAQAAFYSQLLAGLQGIAPRWMHLALGSGELASFKVGDYAAYERQTRRVLRAFIAADPGDNPPADPYPDPVAHCAICRWSEFCAGRRRSDDDLSLIAGITRGQCRALKAADVSTRRGFAALPEAPALRGVSRESLQRAHLQARLQVASEEAGQVRYEILDPERNAAGSPVSNRGLLALPKPAAGDLFFDIEGARYYSEDGTEFGLQYLFGIVDTADSDSSGAPRYTAIWAFDRAGEKGAFEELIDFITERRARHPSLHVYHYNHYEPTEVDHLTELHETRQEAVGRLMGRFATREDDVDDLFRLGVFVDLYRAMRQGVLAGVESYSLKRLEPLCGYARRVDLREATVNLIAFEAALDAGTATGDRDRQRIVAGYNEDDCRATMALRDWLEERRTELAERLGEQLPRPVFVAEAHATQDPEVTRIRSALLASVPADPAARTSEEKAKALLGDLLDWHRREAKPAWWRYFYVRGLSAAELTSEPDALAGLTGGAIVDQVQRSVVRRFSFPPQEHRFSAGTTAYDPVTGKGWSVWAVDDSSGTIDLKIGSSYSGPLPAALVEGGPIDTRSQRDRLAELGERALSDGLPGTDAATALLRRLQPAAGSVQGGPLRGEGETAAGAAVRLAAALSGSYLPVQGPPGTGKTYTGAEQILELVSGGAVVGITGPSHAVIHNLISAVAECAGKRGVAPRIGQRADSGNPFLHPGASRMSYDRLAGSLRGGELDVAAGTVWTWAREQFQRSVDTLVVDEAGQMSLADVLAVAGAARNLVLLGDPQQLAQPSQAAHPPGAGVSALEHILDGRATMPPRAGLLIDQTWRMHPNLCQYTSAVFYDGKLTWAAGLERQEILGDLPPHGSGLRVVEVPHEGNTNSSPEEARAVALLVQELLGRRWRDKNGDRLPITPDQILVVTPYNAQIRTIEEALAGAGCRAGVRVGTVDKFQGREAPVTIYSMATSSAGLAPRGLDFLYDPHRLNVATSRARAMTIIVASPDLVRVYCTTPRQMFLANALCQAWESGQPR
jgi:predicted RecB family nuclease